MPTVHIPCPHCHAVLKSRKPIPEGAVILCRKCGKKFWLLTQGSSALAPVTEGPFTPELVFPSNAGRPAAGEPSSLPDPSPQLVNRPVPLPTDQLASRKRRAEAGVLLGGLGFLLFMGLLTVACYYLSANSKQDRVDLPPPVHVPVVPDEPARPGSVDTVRGAAKPRARPSGEPLARAKTAPLDPTAPVAIGKPLAFEAQPLQSQINQAIDRGVVYLKASLTSPTPLQGESAKTGAVALAGWTLLCCGVSANDPVVQKVAARVRSEGAEMNRTYQIALMILFLDKLGESRDRALIRKLALQLIAGQGVLGGWSYTCELLTPGQQKELLTLLQTAPLSQGTPMSVPRGAAVNRIQAPARVPHPASTNVRANLKQLPVLRFRPGQRIPLRTVPHEDNSLTQFALLALWTAQKHGIPADRSLAMAEMRFRCSQAGDGSWSYMWRSAPQSKTVHTDSMTCAGLLGLALGHVVHPELRGLSDKLGAHPARNDPLPVAEKNLARDPAIARALRYLGRSVGKPALTHERGIAARVNANARGHLYYLWSLERVAVVYDLRTIGGKDWYAWGSAILVDTQNADGSWSDAFPGLVDTSFALLFLKRVNAIPDVTTQLALLGQPKDPGEPRNIQDAGNQPKNALLAVRDKLVTVGEEKLTTAEAPGTSK